MEQGGGNLKKADKDNILCSRRWNKNNELNVIYLNNNQFVFKVFSMKSGG